MVQNALLEYLEKAWPGISSAKRVESYGTSACIQDALGQARTGLGSYHIYMAIEDMGAVLDSLPGERQSEQLRVLRERVLVRCWNAGIGFIFIDSAGRMHPRTLIDLSVFSPERLIFEAPLFCQKDGARGARHRKLSMADGCRSRS